MPATKLPVLLQRVEYEPPRAVLERLEEPVLRRLNEHETQALLENLKLLLEA